MRELQSLPLLLLEEKRYCENSENSEMIQFRLLILKTVYFTGKHAVYVQFIKHTNSGKSW